MGVRVGSWDCSYCNTKSVFGYVYDCPGCGHPRPRGVRFYLLPGAPYATPEQIKLMGTDPNWYCSSCESGNKDENDRCWNCGAPRGSDSVQHEQRVYQPGEAPSSTEEAEEMAKTVLPEPEIEQVIEDDPYNPQPSYSEVEEYSSSSYIQSEDYSPPVAWDENKIPWLKYSLIAAGVLSVLLLVYLFFIRTTTATPTVFEIPTPTMTPIATQGGVIATPSATPTISFNTERILPLANAASVLKVAINHSPNAQLLLIKIDNATDPSTVVTKYFFREDTITKKYFFVSISGNGIPELIDKQIYVNPDDNIPSLNDAILANKMGLDLDEVLKLTYSQCANLDLCTSAPTKAMYIKTGTGIIWQVSLYTKGLSATPLLIQINAETKVINYKSPEFANK